MSEILSVNNVSKTYSLKKGKNRKAVNRLSLSINENEIVGLLGPNGAGKTTLIKMICGLIIPDDGNITLNGKSNIDRNDYYTSFGALLEGSRNIYWKMTIEENMDYFYILKKGHNSNRKQYKEYLLDLMGLSEHRTKTVGQLSRGLQ
ncbi:MAG: ABC transporter ATP-binding protein, partial [Spirochaetales bacterium]|nr:ABC transporter ATP-binding protein [Spirochaetales bacterium]